MNFDKIEIFANSEVRESNKMYTTDVTFYFFDSFFSIKTRNNFRRISFVHFKYLTISIVNYSSIKLKNKTQLIKRMFPLHRYYIFKFSTVGHHELFILINKKYCISWFVITSLF